MGVEEKVQNLYDKIERTINDAYVKYGKTRERIKTDDKLTEETKTLIDERNRLMELEVKSIGDRIKICELCKITKREIKKDIERYEEKIVKLSLIHISEPTRPY